MKIGQIVVYKGFYAQVEKILKSKIVIRLVVGGVRTVKPSSVEQPRNF